MLAKTCKGVIIYFYIKLVTLDGITVHSNIKQGDKSRCLLLGKVTIYSHLHSKLDVPVELFSCPSISGPWAKSQMYRPCTGISRESYGCHLLHREVGNHWRRWQTHRHTGGLVIQLATEAQRRNHVMAKEPSLLWQKISLSRFIVSLKFS
jgi:hypothetical protein